MTQVGLQCTGVGALVGKLETTGMPQHVRMRLKAELGGNAQPRHHLPPPRSAKGRAALGREHERRWRLLVAFEPAQRPEFDAAQGVNGWSAVLGAADMDLPVGKVDGVPAQRHQLDRPQAMPVGEQHHGGVAMTIAVASGRFHELLHLGIGEVLSRPRCGIRSSSRRPAWLNCPINSRRRDQCQLRFCHLILPFSRCSVP